MAKIGVELSIDVTKIHRERLYQGAKGKYLTMTVFVDPDNKDRFDNNGMITHKKMEGEDRAPILGNCKVFWKESQQQSQQPTNYTQQPAPQQNQGFQQQAPQQQVHSGQNANYNQPAPTNPPPAGFDDFDEDIPF